MSKVVYLEVEDILLSHKMVCMFYSRKEVEDIKF